jgi:hypothetical protein
VAEEHAYTLIREHGKMPNHKELGYSFKKKSAVHAKHEELVLVLKGRPETCLE